MEIKVGCELEFQLLNKTKGADGSVSYHSIDNSKFFSQRGFFVLEEDFVEIGEQFEKAGIVLEKIHSESSLG